MDDYEIEVVLPKAGKDTLYVLDSPATIYDDCTFSFALVLLRLRANAMKVVLL